MNVLEALSETRLFKDFPLPELEKLAELAREHRLSPHTVLFSEGDPGDELFVLVMGTVKVLKRNSNSGKEEEIAILGTGSYFGEGALVGKDHIRGATIESQETSFLLGIKQDELNKICDEDARLGMAFYRTLAGALGTRLRLTSDHVAHFKSLALKH